MFAPIGLFPAAQADDPYRQDRIDQRAFLADGHAHDTIWTSVRCMDTLYRLHTLQSEALRQLTNLSQAHFIMFRNKGNQLNELGEEMEQRDAHIVQLEGQVQERDTLLDERNATIVHLEEQLHDLNLDLDDAMDHIDWHHANGDNHNDPPAEMEVDDEEPEGVQGVSGMDFEAATPQPSPMGAHSPASSEASINNLDDF